MANDALNVNAHPAPHGVNGQTSSIGITVRGSDWYWVCHHSLHFASPC